MADGLIMIVVLIAIEMTTWQNYSEKRVRTLIKAGLTIIYGTYVPSNISNIFHVT